jgi:hypothetical protein
MKIWACHEGDNDCFDRSEVDDVVTLVVSKDCP